MRCHWLAEKPWLKLQIIVNEEEEKKLEKDHLQVVNFGFVESCNLFSEIQDHTINWKD